MEMDVGARAAELAGPLEMFPPVDFCCAYGSSLLPNNDNKSAMVDYILGVAEPVQWHAENLERNRHHYASWMAHLGPKTVWIQDLCCSFWITPFQQTVTYPSFPKSLYNWCIQITRVADGIGVGVHFNPFVQWKDKMIKYGVVGMQELARDLLAWDRFYLSGRLQKPVRILVDNYDIEKVNAVNLKAATSAALLLSSPEFTEEELYSKICSLSYMGDLRMLFAEDKNKVNKIVKGSFGSFHKMYKPFIAEYITDGLLKSSTNGPQKAFKQDCGLSASQSLFSSLPWTIPAGLKTAEKVTRDAGGAIPQVAVSSRQEAINCTRRVLRRLVMVSSARQAVSGVLAAGGVNAVRYLGKKMCRAWRSRVS